MPIEKDLIELGRRAVRSSVMAELAVVCAKAAAKNEIDEDSAEHIYMTYRKHGRPAGLLEAPTNRVQVSKLRTIIKSSDPQLLAEVIKAYDNAEGKRRSLYDVMVSACRYHVARGKAPGPRTLMNMMVRR